ncbi:MAG: DUF1570 domain-containing protein [Thermoguttaceae bacterium]|jgi:hypothetical protein
MAPNLSDPLRRVFWMGLVLLAAAGGNAARAMDYVTLRRGGETLRVEGRLVLTAQDGGILLLARDGVLWNIEPAEQVRHTSDELPFHAYPAQELSKRVLGGLPPGFEAYQTTHYLVLHQTSRAYAQWCGALFERLYGAFHNAWSHRGVELVEPEFPLVAIIFADKQSYVKFSARDLGDAAETIIGYFNLATNRMIMYDLTGAAGGRSARGSSTAQINQILADPEAGRAVSTIVHEATHQIAFNCGLHARYSDCPLWFSEGIAMYFETPDLHSAKGWAGVGVVNRARRAQFQSYLARRGPDSLKTLITADTRFRDPKQGLDAYSEAWTLTYFLLRQHLKEYVDYLKMLSKKGPLLRDGPQRRLEEFEHYFGPWQKVDADLLRFMARLR